MSPLVAVLESDPFGLASLSAGMLQHTLGWQMVNYVALPFIAVIVMSVIWLKKKPEEQRLHS